MSATTKLVVEARANRERWVVGAKRWRVAGCTCGCSGDGLEQYLNPTCPYYAAHRRALDRAAA